MRWSRVNHW